MCPRTKYNRRLVCNSCERHKLASRYAAIIVIFQREKYGNDLPTASRSESSTLTMETESTLPARTPDVVSQQQHAAPMPMPPSYPQPLPSNPVVQMPANQPLVQPMESYHLPPYSLNGSSSSHNVMFSEVAPRGIVDCRETTTFFRRNSRTS